MITDRPLVPIGSLADVLAEGLVVDERGRPSRPLVLVDLDTPATAESAVDGIADAVDRAPVAAVTLAQLLRQLDSLSIVDGLAAESAAYSMLLAVREFRTWLDGRTGRPAPGRPELPVRLERDGASLTVTLNVPARHNAFSRWVRDGLAEAIDLVTADESIRVVIRGAGPSFCSGGARVGDGPRARCRRNRRHHPPNRALAYCLSGPYRRNARSRAGGPVGVGRRGRRCQTARCAEPPSR